MEELSRHIREYKSSGDLAILGRIYQDYMHKVFRLCMHFLKSVEDSEDAVVDIFLELQEKLFKHDVQNFPAWLHTLARNHCLKKLRTKGRLILTDTFSDGGHVEIAPTPDQIDEYIGMLPEAMDRLDERQRWCLVLFYLEGKSYKDIQSAMGYTAMEVKSGIQNGKVKLKKLLEDHANGSI